MTTRSMTSTRCGARQRGSKGSSKQARQGVRVVELVHRDQPAQAPGATHIQKLAKRKGCCALAGSLQRHNAISSWPDS